MRKVKSVTINGKRWRVEWKPLRGEYGTSCNSEKVIEMDSGMKDNVTVATILIHEMLHGMWPDVEEDAICQRADELCLALNRVGLIADDD